MVVLEVGIGGRLDATNIIPDPVVCGITALGMDHMDMLGDTLPVSGCADQLSEPTIITSLNAFLASFTVLLTQELKQSATMTNCINLASLQNVSATIAFVSSCHLGCAWTFLRALQV